MDRGKYKKLNGYHVVFLVQSSFAGLGALSLPNSISPMGYKEWLVIILMGIVASIALIPMVILGRQYPKDSLFTIHEKLLGSFLGKVVSSLVIFYGILSIAGACEGYLRLVQTSLLPNKGTATALLFLLVVAIYVVQGGIKSVARFCIITFFFTNWLLYFIQWPIASGDYRNLFTEFYFSPQDLFQAFHRGYFSMLGYELILFYFPYIIHQKKALKHALTGLWITILTYATTSITSIIYFSEWQLVHLQYPVLHLLRSIKLHFIERIENLFIALWVFLVLSTVCVYLWVVKKGLDSVFNKRRGSHLYVSVVGALLLIVSPIPERLQNYFYKELLVYFGYAFLLWPMVLLFIHKISNKRKVSV